MLDKGKSAKKILTQGEEQKNEFLKIATQYLQKEETEADQLAI